MRKSNNVVSQTSSKGMAMVTVLLVMLVLAILTTGIVVIGISNFNQSAVTVDHNQVYFVAEAGINYQVKKLEDQIVVMNSNGTNSDNIMSTLATWLASGNAAFSMNFPQTNGSSSNVNFTATITADSTKKSVTISSTGTVQTGSRVLTRTLEKTISFSGFNIDKAIIATGTLAINKDNIFFDSNKTSGIIQSMSTELNSVIIDKLAIVDKVYIRTPTDPTKTFIDVIKGCEIYDDLTKPNLNFCRIGGVNGKGGIIVEIIYDDISPLPPGVTIPPIPPLTSPYLNEKIYTVVGVKNNAIVPFISAGGNNKPPLGNLTINSNSVNVDTIYSIPDANSQKSVFFVPKFEIGQTVGDFTIDVGDKDVNIVTNSLVLNGSFKIKSTGSGKLTVFVPLSGFSSSCNNKVCGAIKTTGVATVADKFVVVITGTTGSTLEFTGNGEYYLSIQTNADINFAIIGNWKFYGFIATSAIQHEKNAQGIIPSNISLGGNVTGNMLIYAPLGKVGLSGSAFLSGAIIANSYESGEGNKVQITFNGDYSKTPYNFLKPLNNATFSSTIEK